MFDQEDAEEGDQALPEDNEEYKVGKDESEDEV